MQCLTEEVVVEDVKECLKIDGLYWTAMEICQNDPLAIKSRGLDLIEL